MNEDGGGVVVKFARPGQTLPYPPPPLKRWEEETLLAKIGWCLAFALLAAAVPVYLGLLAFSIWIFPDFPPLLIGIAIATYIGLWDGNTLSRNSPYAVEKRRWAHPESASQTDDR